MPPPPAFSASPLSIGGTQFVQPVADRAMFCSPPSSMGTFQQTAWVEPRVGKTRLRVSLQLFYKQNEFDESWELKVSTDDSSGMFSSAVEDTNVVRAQAQTPPGCWLWVVNAE